MRNLAAAIAALLALAGAAVADDAYDKCIETSDGSNPAWSKCGAALLEREDVRLNEAWKRVFAQFDGRVRNELQEEQRAWIAFKEKSCLFFANGGFGREGQVLAFPTCRARIIAARTEELEEYAKYR